jgi:hypothetical protein
MTKALAIPSEGSKPLKNNMHERYARLRAQALPRIVAYRQAGNSIKSDNAAGVNACRLEKKCRERILYLQAQAQERVIEKRQRIEEQLWAIHEADIGDYFETHEAAKVGKDGKLATDADGKMLTVRKQRPKLLSDLPPEFRKLIEDVSVDRSGNVIPKLYSRVQANAELRRMLNIGRSEDRPESEAARLSDAELVAQLADQAKQLGIEINLAYSFASPPVAEPSDEPADPPVIDNKSEP